MVVTRDKNTLYTCTTEECYAVSKYVKDGEAKKWEKVEDLPRSDNDETEVMLQLKMDKHDKVLFGESFK